MRKPLFAIPALLAAACAHPGAVAPVAPPEPELALQTGLQRGWNTWNNTSLLSHVLLPEGLALNLLLRRTRGAPHWLRASYVRRPWERAQNRELEEIRPGLHAYDGSYSELELLWGGVHADVRTATDGDDILILFSPRKPPEQNTLLVLESALLWNRPGRLSAVGDGIVAELAGRRVPIAATRSPLPGTLPLASPHLVLPATDEVGFFTGHSRTVAEMRAVMDRARARELGRSQRFGALADAHQAMKAAMAWNLIYEPQQGRVFSSVSRRWNDDWGGFILFDWDTYFGAWMLSIDDAGLAHANALAITRTLSDRGFVPNVAAAWGVKSQDRSQPPVGSLTCKAIYDRHRELWFLRAVYDSLLSWNRWWVQARDNQGFLSWGSDPHPHGLDAHDKQAAMYESGLDNSPLFDDVVFDGKTHMLALADVGLMGLYVADCRALADIADTLGKTTDARELRARAEHYAGKLGELWDEDAGIYRDRDLRTGKASPRLAPTNFYPLLGRVPTQAQAERMINEHLLEPREFFGPFMVPSIARDDPAYADNEYWRGRIWAPMNFLVYLGLRNYDLPAARKLLAERSLSLLLAEWRAHRHVHENYNADTGQGDDVRHSDSFYSWGGLLGLIGLLEGGH